MSRISPLTFVMKQTVKQVIILLLIAIVLGFLRQWAPSGITWIGKWPTASTSAKDAYQMVKQDGDPAFVSLQDAIQKQKEGMAIFLDSRTMDAYKKGRIPGSRSLPYYKMESYYEKVLVGIKADDDILVYCEGIDCDMAIFLGRDLMEFGYTKVGIFFGGYPEWKGAGLPIEK